MSSSESIFSEVLASFLYDQDRSASWLAQRIGISRGTIARWLSRESLPRNPEVVLRIALELDLSREKTDELLVASGMLPTAGLIETVPFQVKDIIARLNEKWNGKLIPNTAGICAFCGRLEEEVKRLIPGPIGYSICDECAARSVETLAQEGFKVRIIRTIEFTPEHYQAGISILNYFGTVLRQKHTDLKAKVRIEQDDLKVTLVVESPNGEQETVERTLGEFGLVVAGQMTAEEFLGDPLQALELKQHLRMTQLQLEHQKELHMFAQKQYETRVKSLEEQVVWLHTHICDMLHHTHTTISITKVKTEGGTFLQGNADVAGGDFVGHNKLLKSD